MTVSTIHVSHLENRAYCEGERMSRGYIDRFNLLDQPLCNVSPDEIGYGRRDEPHFPHTMRHSKAPWLPTVAVRRRPTTGRGRAAHHDKRSTPPGLLPAIWISDQVDD